MTPANIRAKIMRFAARPEGISREDTARSFSMNNRSTARQMLDELEADGTLFGVLHPLLGKRGTPKTRLFTTQAAAEKWRDGPLPVSGNPPGARSAPKPGAELVAKDKPPTFPREGSQVPRVRAVPVRHIEPKITIAPPFVDRRWVPDVVTPVVDSRECRAWAAVVAGGRA
jgi:hypothetical protein